MSTSHQCTTGNYKTRVSKTPWMGHTAVGPLCCVTHVKDPGAGFALVFLAVAAECALAPCKPLKIAV